VKRTKPERTAPSPGVGRQDGELVADALCVGAGAPRSGSGSAGEDPGALCWRVRQGHGRDSGSRVAVGSDRGHGDSERGSCCVVRPTNQPESAVGHTGRRRGHRAPRAPVSALTRQRRSPSDEGERAEGSAKTQLWPTRPGARRNGAALRVANRLTPRPRRLSAEVVMKGTMRERGATSAGEGCPGGEPSADALCGAAAVPTECAWSAGADARHAEAGGQLVVDRSHPDRGQRGGIAMDWGKGDAPSGGSDLASKEWTCTGAGKGAAAPITGRHHWQRRKGPRGQRVQSHLMASEPLRYGIAQGPGVRAWGEHGCTARDTAPLWFLTNDRATVYGPVGQLGERPLTDAMAGARWRQCRSHRVHQGFRGSPGPLATGRCRPSEGGEQADASANTQVQRGGKQGSHGGAGAKPPIYHITNPLPLQTDSVLKKTIPGTAL